MKHKILICFFLSFAFVVIKSNAQKANNRDLSIEDDIRKQIDKILAHDVEIIPEETPGCLIGIIEVDTFFILEYGNRADQSGPLLKEDVFDLGGLSKVFISPVAAHLVLDGQFKFSDKILSDFPEFRDTELAEITFEQLLKHESGIKKILIGLEAKTKDQRVEEVVFLEVLKDNHINEKKDFKYSHHNHALLTLWMERRIKKPFSEILDNFFARQNDVNKPEIFVENKKLIAEFSGISKVGQKEYALDYGTHEYSLGIQSRMEAVIHYVQDFWLDETNEVAQLALGNATSTKIRKGLDFSRSYYTMDNRKYTIYTHSGRSNRHTAAIHFVPETQTGIVLFSNSEIGTKDLSLLVLRMINHNWKRKAHGQEK